MHLKLCFTTPRHIMQIIIDAHCTTKWFIIMVASKITAYSICYSPSICVLSNDIIDEHRSSAMDVFASNCLTPHRKLFIVAKYVVPSVKCSPHMQSHKHNRNSKGARINVPAASVGVHKRTVTWATQLHMDGRLVSRSRSVLSYTRNNKKETHNKTTRPRTLRARTPRPSLAPRRVSEKIQCLFSEEEHGQRRRRRLLNCV